MKFIAISALIATVLAGFEINNPVSDTVGKAGQTLDIKWEGAEENAKFDIVLVNGDDTDLQDVMTIATDVDAKLNKFAWSIPSGFTTNHHDYSIKFQKKGDSYHVADPEYSAHFQIESTNEGGYQAGAPKHEEKYGGYSTSGAKTVVLSAGGLALVFAFMV